MITPEEETQQQRRYTGNPDMDDTLEKGNNLAPFSGCDHFASDGTRANIYSVSFLPSIMRVMGVSTVSLPLRKTNNTLCRPCTRSVSVRVTLALPIADTRESFAAMSTPSMTQTKLVLGKKVQRRVSTDTSTGCPTKPTVDMSTASGSEDRKKVKA